MANTNNKKIIRIYGVTMPRPEARLRPYGFGEEEVDGERVAYVDYFIKDLVDCIDKSGLKNIIIKKLN